MTATSPRRRLGSIVSATLVTALVVALPAGCERGGEHGQWGGEGKGKKEVMEVETITLAPAKIERYYRTSGTLKAIQEAEIVATQPAIITSIEVDEGDTVERGQLLAKLDGRELQLQAAQAGMQAENLERELQRLESVAKGAISAEEIDKQRYAVEEARALAKLSRHQAKQTVVRAPFDGTVVARYVDRGNLATTATPLVKIADLRVLELELHLPEKDAATVAIGSEVSIELVDGTAFPAKVAKRAPIVDELTGTVKFTVQAETYPEKAMPGAFARASVLVDMRESAPSLAKSSVFEVEGKPHVYVIDQGKARRRPVELGLEGNDRVEIVSGVEPDDIVVSDGNAGISEGMPLKQAAAPSSAADAKIAGEPGPRPGA